MCLCTDKDFIELFSDRERTDNPVTPGMIDFFID